MTIQSKTLELLTSSHPDIQFVPGASYHWSPANKIVYYTENDESVEGVWALLHETSHGLLGHAKYRSDFELLLLEVAAWEHAKLLATNLSVDTGNAYNEHMEDCLDSYRNWLHKRSLCPDCSLSSVQIDASTYSCIFCHKRWKVTAERFCRPYRKTLA